MSYYKDKKRYYLWLQNRLKKAYEIEHSQLVLDSMRDFGFGEGILNKHLEAFTKAGLITIIDDLVMWKNIRVENNETLAKITE